MKTGRNPLILSRPRQHITGKLLNRELIIRKVAIDRVNDPVTIWPDRPCPVLFVTIRIGIAGEVQPAATPSLTVMRRCEQSIDQSFVRIR